MEVDVELKGSGLEFKGKVSLFQATQIMGFIAKPEVTDGTDASPTVLTNVERLDAPQAQAAYVEAELSSFESPRQAIEQLKAKTNGQKIVAISLFLGASSRNGKVVEHDLVLEEFARAGQPTPANFTRDIKDAVSDGYIYPIDKKSFRLLSTTDNLEETGFKKTKRKRTATKTSDGERVKLTVRPEIAGLPMTTTLDGFIDYFDTPARADQILWILQFAKVNGMDALNRLEISTISSKLGGDINPQSFTSANTPNVKNGYITTTAEMISLSVKGDKYFSALKAKTED